MREQAIITWQDGRVVDEQPLPSRPWSFVVGVLALLLALDLALALVLARVPAPLDGEVVDVASARRELQAAADEPETSWLLVGDSVLAGDVMRGAVEDWRSQRVIDKMRAAIHPDSGVRLRQFALDALLPIDIEHIVQELDAVDPTARVAVAIEVNPRYFSAHYASEPACTRPFLCQLGPTVPGSRDPLPGLAPWLAALTYEALGDWLPVYRHRSRLAPAGLFAAVPPLATPREPPGQPDVLAGRARVLAHYQVPALGSDSVQVRALRRTVRRLQASGRRAVLFTTPLEDGFVAEAMTPEEYGDYIARVSEIVERASDGEVELVNLDHPLFSSPLFLDHCHLGPEGNRRLAVNLLIELGIGIAAVPGRSEVVHVEGPDTTLVARVDAGSANGAAWQAAFDAPRGVAVAPGGRRVVVADTGNHCLRELTGNLQTVRLLAGTPGQAGDHDGPASEALLEWPKHPALIDDTVWFVDGGTRLRHVTRGEVGTATVTKGPTWTRIDMIVADRQRLLLLVDSGEALLAYDPHLQRSRKLVKTRNKARIKAFAVAPDGRIFLADHNNRILVGDDRGAMTVGNKLENLRVEFPNLGLSVPQKRGTYFPLTYAEAGFSDIDSMTWVDRYSGLLVMDDIPSALRARRPSERIQLRLLDIDADRVYPWIKPLVHAGGQILRSHWSDSYLSYFHAGAMALDQDTATLFWLERDRSRLFHLADGILGAAKAGLVNDLEFHGVRDLFGIRSAAQALAKLRPDRFLGRRLEHRPRQGPYLGVVFGSSMISVSDLVGFYSFGVRLEDRLREALGYQDGIRIDIVQRSYRGVPSEKVLQELRNFVEVGAQPDVIFIELNGQRNRFFRKDASDERMREILAEVDRIARRYDSLVVFFDDAALVSPGHDGLRPTPGKIERFKAMARASGFLVIDLSDELLREALDLSPFGSPPYDDHHAAPWAVDAAADLLGDRVYPHLREHLRGRVPAPTRPPVVEDLPVAALVGAFPQTAVDWSSLLPTLPGESVQSDLSGDHLQIFVDLRDIVVDREDPAALSVVAAAALYSVIVLDNIGAHAQTVELRLATFNHYDEYGAAMQDAAEVVYERRFDLAGLVEFLDLLVDREPEE